MDPIKALFMHQQKSFLLQAIFKMGGINDYRRSDNIQVYESACDADTDDYVEIDTPEKEEELQQNKRNVNCIVKECNCTCNSYGISKFKYYPTLFFGVSSTVILVIISILLIVMYAKIAAFEFSSNSHDIFSCNRSQLLLCNDLQNLYDRNQELFNDWQRKTANISSAFSRLLYEFNEELTNDLEEGISGNGYLPNTASCGDILHRNLSSSSGYYLVRSSTGQLTSVYCDMTRTCGNITGGWMRVAELDLDHCFTGLRSQSFDGVRTCVVSEDRAGCTSVLFSSFNSQYTSICGKIRGYGVGTVDGLYRERTLRGSIGDNYLDGISVSSDGSHIWSFVAGDCTCNYKPPFIGNDWTCDGTGCSEGNFCNKLLWNSSICGEGDLFLKQFSSSTTADINVTVCRDEPRDNEGIAITVLELYVN